MKMYLVMTRTNDWMLFHSRADMTDWINKFTVSQQIDMRVFTGHDIQPLVAEVYFREMDGKVLQL